MISSLLAITLFLLLSAHGAEEPDLVDIAKIDFSIRQDIRYATSNNFTKKQVYPEAMCLLRKPVALALSRAQAHLKLQNLSLKVFDCYRPLAVQKRFWELVPDERYVADPKKGSRHNRGAAVDVTIVELRGGHEIEMPSGYDDFSEKAHRDYKRSSKKARRNMELLEKAMVREGFVPMPTEWWHFDFKGWESYPLLDVPFSDFK